MWTTERFYLSAAAIALAVFLAAAPAKAQDNALGFALSATEIGGVARCCANTESPASAAPATAPIAFTMPRREIWCVFMEKHF